MSIAFYTQSLPTAMPALHIGVTVRQRGHAEINRREVEHCNAGRHGKRVQSQTVDSQGRPLRTVDYSNHGPDGSYRIDVKDGNGKTIQRSDFNGDGSGIERGFHDDGSRLETTFGPSKSDAASFGAQSPTKLMTQYDAQGREKQKDYFDPDQGINTNQVVTRADGSKTMYSFNDQEKVGLQNDYDAKGKPVDTYRYDSGSGKVSSHTHFNEDGSRTLDSIDAGGKATRMTSTNDGQRSTARPATFSAAEQQALKEHGEHASKIVPPQPVGADTALGNQRTYFDPASNRLTNQDIKEPDGSTTSYAYNSMNLVGYEQHFDPNGRIVSSKHYAPHDSPDVITQYAPDGSRQVMRPNNGQPVIEHYNADGQLTQKQSLLDAGFRTDNYDAQAGRVVNTNMRNKDGSYSDYAYNDLGNVGAKFDYDSKGKAISSVAFDRNENSGTITAVNYNADGGRDVTKTDSAGTTVRSIGGEGRNSNTQSRPMTSADRASLNQWMWGAGMTPGRGANEQQTQGQTQTQPQAQPLTQAQPQPQPQAQPEGGSNAGDFINQSTAASPNDAAEDTSSGDDA